MRIGFANFFANIVQIGGNQLSGRLMAYGAEGYPWIFTMYFVLALTSFVLALTKNLWEGEKLVEVIDSNGMFAEEFARRTGIKEATK